MSIKESFKWIKDNAPEEVIDDMVKLSENNVRVTNRYNSLVSINRLVLNILGKYSSGVKSISSSNITPQELTLSLVDEVKELSELSAKVSSEIDIEKMLQEAVKKDEGESDT